MILTKPETVTGHLEILQSQRMQVQADQGSSLLASKGGEVLDRPPRGLFVRPSSSQVQSPQRRTGVIAWSPQLFQGGSLLAIQRILALLVGKSPISPCWREMRKSRLLQASDPSWVGYCTVSWLFES